MSTRSISALVVPGYLALAGCSSGITQADQICTSSRISVAAFVDCLRSNYGTLSNGSSGQSDLGALYWLRPNIRRRRLPEAVRPTQWPCLNWPTSERVYLLLWSSSDGTKSFKT